MNKEEWIEEAKKLANEYAHCYSFVGDNSMRFARDNLYRHLECIASISGAALPRPLDCIEGGREADDPPAELRNVVEQQARGQF